MEKRRLYSGLMSVFPLRETDVLWDPVREEVLGVHIMIVELGHNHTTAAEEDKGGMEGVWLDVEEGEAAEWDFKIYAKPLCNGADCTWCVAKRVEMKNWGGTKEKKCQGIWGKE